MIKESSSVVSNEASREEKLPWWRKLIRFFLKWNPISWFFRQLRKMRWFGMFVDWVKKKLGPKMWYLTKESAARGAIGAIGGIGSMLVNQFMESKDGKWNRAMDGTICAPSTGLFQNGSSVAVSNKPAYGYGSTASTSAPSETFPFSR